MLRILLLCLIGSIVSEVTAQTTKIPAIVERLFNEKKSVTVFTRTTQQLFFPPDLPSNFRTSSNKIVKTDERLFLNILGTGRIYQLIRSDSAFTWKRLDSTYYTGYNFSSLFFHWGDKLYSYGGIGFFNYNGNLRYFNSSSREWA
ncbi:MAG: hypothetical protein ACKO03_03315 [Bacteroidota bacterium]